MDPAALLDLGSALTPLIKTLAEHVREKFPALVERGEEWTLQSPDRRMASALTKRDGKVVLALLVEKSDSWALRRAEEIRREHRSEVVVAVTGTAFSAKPTKGSMKRGRAKRLAPGSSVGHFRGDPGTLGCFVETEDWLGFTSASHVLGMRNTADPGDAVLHPAPGDGPRTRRGRIGRLEDYSYMVHHQEKDQPPRNREDIALVRFDDEDRCTGSNMVPNPRDPDRNLKIKRVHPAVRLFEQIAEDVYKVGRTTGFTEGVLEYSNIQSFPVRLPDRKVYMFGEIAAVKRKGKGAFSGPGDSGSLVYTKDGTALGFVIGGSDEYTFVSPVEACLEMVEAKMLL